MKNLISTAAVALVAAVFALGTPALAQSHHGGGHDRGSHDRGGHEWGRHDRGGYDRDHRDRGDYDRGGYSRGDRWHHDRDWGRDRYDRRDYDRRDYGRYRHYDRGSHQGWRTRSTWYRGGYVSRYDYDRGYVVDYRYQRGLYRPPYGYEWRRVDDNYVLVAIATGLIASIILNSGY